MLKPIEWKNSGVKVLDQTLLPERVVYRTLRDYRDVAAAIKNLIVRGAPLIGVAAAMGAALGAKNIKTKDIKKFKNEFRRIINTLGSTRPTAVNLFWALERMKTAASGGTVAEIKENVLGEAKKILAADIRINRLIGKHGQRLIKTDSTVLTHCNAGALATAGYGTALGVVRAAVEAGKKVRVLADETRPVLQGARLTAWELKEDGIDVMLITDSMAGYMMEKGLVDCVVVGADRIAANGDAANKIGTYSLSVLSRFHSIPFYVAAPSSTFDLTKKSGRDIPIEERNEKEVTEIKGRKIAPRGVRVKNPAFDVTPARLISAIITEKGVLAPPYEKSIKKMLRQG